MIRRWLCSLSGHRAKWSVDEDGFLVAECSCRIVVHWFPL
jgi:hypothetical protein